jgi:deoxycytidylate deaminase
MSDHSTQVGAAVGACYGYNKEYGDGVRIHAETHALLLNARRGVSVEGHTMYAPWAACKECAIHIIAAGVARVVVHHERMQLTPVHWHESVDHGLHLLVQNGVEVVAISKVFQKTVVIGGEEVVL